MSTSSSNPPEGAHQDIQGEIPQESEPSESSDKPSQDPIYVPEPEDESSGAEEFTGWGIFAGMIVGGSIFLPKAIVQGIFAGIVGGLLGAIGEYLLHLYFDHKTDAFDPVYLGNFDAYYDVLGNQRRLFTILVINKYGAIDMWDLAKKVEELESGRYQTSPSEEAVKQQYVSLYQTHVPKMSDMEILKFDEENETASPGPEFDRIYSLLSVTLRFLSVDPDFPELADIFNILEYRRQRILLKVLYDQGEPMTVQELAKDVSQTLPENEQDTKTSFVKTYAYLTETFLPKLDERNIVTYHDEHNTCELKIAGKRITQLVYKLESV
ncbi:DUF7344 domain-containing protein [Halomicrobium salinisoli]|uniref:DUF7344 domain-containing protein n=1 Tax=Halomicrobium salinisoli TaxID=2878391 RepID=UPI001CF03B74|nr:hypothetical protein [Halomicrobium salinisoli]